MNSLQRQWIENVWAAGDGDVRHMPLGVVTGAGQTPDGCPHSPLGLRLLLRSPTNDSHIEPDNVVGAALPRIDTVTAAQGTQITAASLSEPDDYWNDHLLIMTSGAQQGYARRVVDFASAVLTIDQAFPSDPANNDKFYLMPLRVTEQAWRGHNADTCYYYGVQEITGGGVRGLVSDPVRVEFDGSVQIRGPSPNVARNVASQPISGGQFEVRWVYVQKGQGAPPKNFQVFDDAGTGTIDFNTPLTDSKTGLNYVPWQPGQAVYSFTTAAYADGAQRIFAVRARNDNNLAQLDPPLVTKVKAAVAVGPAVIQKVQAVLGVSN